MLTKCTGRQINQIKWEIQAIQQDLTNYLIKKISTLKKEKNFHLNIQDDLEQSKNQLAAEIKKNQSLNAKISNLENEKVNFDPDFESKLELMQQNLSAEIKKNQSLVKKISNLESRQQVLENKNDAVTESDDDEEYVKKNFISPVKFDLV